METVIGVEISHARAPLSVREKVCISLAELDGVIDRLREKVAEVFVLSTCNRCSIYAIASTAEPVVQVFRSLCKEDIEPYMAVYRGEAAVRHLFATAAGLESQIVGETEILHQIRQAYARAHESRAIGALLDELVRRALRAGKRVRAETALGRRSTSVASMVSEVVREFFPAAAAVSALVIGTGDIGRLLAGQMARLGNISLTIASKSSARAAEIADVWDAHAVDFATIAQHLAKFDVVIGATETTEYIVRCADIGQRVTPLLLFDLGMPRNMEPALADQQGVLLYNLDDVKDWAQQSEEERKGELPKAWAILAEEVEEVMDWQRLRTVAPVLSLLWEQLNEIRQDELQWALPKMGKLDSKQREIVEKLSYRIVRKLARSPIHTIREYARQPLDNSERIDAFKQIFGLEK